MANSSRKFFDFIFNWAQKNPRAVLVIITIAALAPFLTKPFNIDDPLFVWTAQHIKSHPGNAYGFKVNWYGVAEPMWLVMQNPSLMSYYLAMAATILGWSEMSLHIACLLPALAVILGSYRLARRFCRFPLLAGLIVLFNPGFLVSCTTVMCDVTMLAFWVWASVLWLEGLKQKSDWKLVVAGTLMGLAILTKYSGVCLIPLLAAYSWFERRSIKRWIAYLLIPIVMLGGHEVITNQIYGYPHFLLSCVYAQNHQTTHGSVVLFKKALAALSFMGGGFAIALFCVLACWNKKNILLIILMAVLVTSIAASFGMLEPTIDGNNNVGTFSLIIQFFLWSIGGVCILMLALTDFWQNRNAESCMLALWVCGIVAFVVFIYWMVNIRAILPMIPAVAILIIRQLERKQAISFKRLKIAVLAAILVSMLVTQADFQQAANNRKMAQKICVQLARDTGRVWFQGHWGFQYYMEAMGAWPLDSKTSVPRIGDVIVVPPKDQNTNITSLDKHTVTQLGIYSIPNYMGIDLMNFSTKAGFYSSLWGPLPFIFGHKSSADFFVYRLTSLNKN